MCSSHIRATQGQIGWIYHQWTMSSICQDYLPMSGMHAAPQPKGQWLRQSPIASRDAVAWIKTCRQHANYVFCWRDHNSWKPRHPSIRSLATSSSRLHLSSKIKYRSTNKQVRAQYRSHVKGWLVHIGGKRWSSGTNYGVLRLELTFLPVIMFASVWFTRGDAT